MDKNRIIILVEKFNNNTISVDEQSELEQLVSQGLVNISELPELSKIERSLENLSIPEPGNEMDPAFYNMLRNKLKSGKKNYLHFLREWYGYFTRSFLNNRVAYPAFLLVAGFCLGFILNFRSGQKQINALNSQVKEIHEMLVVSLLEKPNATDRLRAVNLTMDLKSADNKVIDALMNTLNHDENVNVRLAAIDALYNYAQNERVRRGFIEALGYQDSPIVLVTLADVLVSLQEKRSVHKLEQLLKSKNLNKQVKDKIQLSIKKIS